VRYLVAALMQSVLIGTVYAYAATDGDDENRRKLFVRGTKIGFVLFPLSLSINAVVTGGDRARSALSRHRS
jgi:hypothetical protein